MTEIFRQTNFSAGADLSASERTVIPAKEIVLVPTGFKLDNDLSFGNTVFYLLAARSSLAYKKGLLLANGVGIIDYDYKDEVKVMLYNTNDRDIVILKDERIAQLIPMNYLPHFPALDSVRNGGFGSTGE